MIKQSNQEKEMKKVQLLRRLCLIEPELIMTDLGKRVELSVEEVYWLIKHYHLPYYWKFQKDVFYYEGEFYLLRGTRR
ncbi:hypothetical protein [Enterococcus faecalis]|uniref:hypothetical protein n=1 Tax=Enterococcus faecalis TaxID=1351 RepID=UPI002FBEC648